MTAEGLRAAGYHPTCHDLRPLMTARPDKRTHLNTESKGGVWLIHANPVEALAAASKIEKSEWERRYRIGYWAYELPAAPKEWIRFSRFFHEIWTPSQFVADALADAKCKVRIVPHYHDVRPPAGGNATRQRFGLSETDFIVGAAGDLRSSGYRKNLEGAIEIYKSAFPSDQANTKMLVKVSNSDTDHTSYSRLVECRSGRQDIQLVSENFSDDEMRGFIAAHDVILSPHRSEGYGLLISEAILNDVKVLATAWSGNMDFMKGADALLIDFDLIEMNDPTGVYRGGASAKWAEPDLRDAVEKLRALKAQGEPGEVALHLAKNRVIEGNDNWSPVQFARQKWTEYVL